MACLEPYSQFLFLEIRPITIDLHYSEQLFFDNWNSVGGNWFLCILHPNCSRVKDTVGTIGKLVCLLYRITERWNGHHQSSWVVFANASIYFGGKWSLHYLPQKEKIFRDCLVALSLLDSHLLVWAATGYYWTNEGLLLLNYFLGVEVGIKYFLVNKEVIPCRQ